MWLELRNISNKSQRNKTNFSVQLIYIAIVCDREENKTSGIML
jgi:hypothetical protein